MTMLEQILHQADELTAENMNLITSQATDLLIQERERGSIDSGKIQGGLISLVPRGEITVAGDIHGDLQSLGFILEDSKFLERVEANRDARLLFLGDYGDRGPYSPEVFYVVLWLKTSFPNNVILLRGNHEGPPDLTPVPHDLPYQLQTKFGVKGDEVYLNLKRLFNVIPFAVISEGRYLFLHGGVPSSATSIEEIAYAYENHPMKACFEEILWSDPVDGFAGTHPSPRGAGRLFGEDVTSRILELVGAKVLIRGHEPCMEGVSVKHGGRVLTIFSRKGAPYHNMHAAYLRFDLGAEAMDAHGLLEIAIKF